MPLQKYNPKRMTGSWKGIIGTRPFAVQFVGGWMDDEMVTASYAGDRVTEHEGADGTVTIVLNASELATVKIMLSQGAPINDQLSQLFPSAKRNYLPVGAFDFVDLNGTTKIKSPRAWLKTTAEIVFGKEVKGREWTFGLSDAELFVGGAGNF